MTEANSARRLAIVGVLVFALFAGLLTRLWFLQVTGGEKLAVAAQAQRDRFVTVPALRGTIYDRNGTPLAQTMAVTSLVVDRQHLSTPDRKTLETNLGALLSTPEVPVTPEDVGKLIDNANYATFEKVPVAKNISLAQAIYVTEHRAEFPGVEKTTTAVRQYPNNYQAADILGYLGQVNQDDLTSHKGEGYQARDTIGKAGVERLFESELRGKPGRNKVEVDNQNRLVNEIPVTKPEAGHDVRLTIDLPSQQVAEESLIQGMEGARSLVDPDGGNYYEANAGAVVVLDARTGSLVAMASNPGFNPNDFISGNADQYFKDPNNPMINRALNALAPGSTFKTITSIGMLQSGLFPEGANHTVSESPAGCFSFGNENDVRCNAGKAVLGTVDLPSALTVSSDVYFYSVGNSFWNAYRDEGKAAGKTGDLAGDDIPDAQHPLGNALQHTARAYGFGESTGMGIGDQSGVIPDHEYRVKLNPGNPELQFWRRGDNASLAVGQGDVLVTPLQLANAYAAFANGGTLFTPRLADEVTQSSVGLPPGQLGPVIRPLDSLVKRSTGLTPDVQAPIEAGLAGVVDPNGRGTAAGAFADYQGPQVIGKTGTAQRTAERKQDTSWFAAITNPGNDPGLPQYVVVAMVEQGGFGASVAAPIVRRVIDFLNNPMAVPAPVVVNPATGTEASN
jgi:penicillin-binding protein 2